jgi:hypothetical protein
MAEYKSNLTEYPGFGTQLVVWIWTVTEKRIWSWVTRDKYNLQSLTNPLKVIQMILIVMVQLSKL